MVIRFGLRQYRKGVAVICWTVLFMLATLGLAVAQSAPVLPECTCRAFGQMYKLGEQVCLATPTGYRMASCEMSQNMTNWNFSNQTCNVSLRPTTLRVARLLK